MYIFLSKFVRSFVPKRYCRGSAERRSFHFEFLNFKFSNIQVLFSSCKPCFEFSNFQITTFNIFKLVMFQSLKLANFKLSITRSPNPSNFKPSNRHRPN